MAVGQGQADYKFVVALSKKIEPGVAMNAAAHMVACLIDQASEEDRNNMMFVDYIDADGGKHPVSGLSLIVLSARNSNHIRRARNAAMEQGVLFVDFTETMTKDTYVEQMERTKQTKEQDLEYWGIALFGLKKVLGPITGKFSVWR